MNRDLPLVIGTSQMEWQDSPMAGVRRRPLERERKEEGQVTSVVLYEPRSHFSEHSHPGGEEIFVLEGEFADENGRYPAGTYLRNPPGSKHSPFSDPGCRLLVKLNQFDPDDSEVVARRPEDQEWRPGRGRLRVVPLHEFAGKSTALVHWPRGARFQPHRHWGGEEIFVLEGVFEDEHGSYPAGTWIRSPHGSQHNPFSTEGCTILVKVGHMA